MGSIPSDPSDDAINPNVTATMRSNATGGRGKMRTQKMNKGQLASRQGSPMQSGVYKTGSEMESELKAPGT